MIVTDSSLLALAEQGLLDELCPGVPLCSLPGGDLMLGLIKGAVAKHGEEDVAASSGEGDEGLIVAFSWDEFAVVIGA